MENQPAFHPLDYISVLRRRVWWLITPIAIALVVGAALAIFLPRLYQSEAVVGISLPAMSGQVLSDLQRLTPQERTRNLNQVLLSPPVLERVVKEERLAETMTVGEAVSMVAAGTSVRLPTPDPNVPAGAVEQFFIGFQHEQPDVAQRVANKLVEVFIDESSMKRTIRAEQTAMFVHEALEASQVRLNDLEARRREAQEAYMGSLPEQTQSNVAMANNLQQQLQSTVSEYRVEQDRLALIERELSATRPVTEAEAGTPGSPMASPAAARVAQLEKELATARNIYTDKYPGLARLQRELDAAKEAAAAEASLPEETRVAALKADPNYAALVRDREQARLRIEALRRQQDDIRSRIGMYTNRVETAPRVEQQFASLTREYELEKKRYGDLTTQLRDAEMAEAVERSQGGERFAILARAPYPSEPASPDIPRLMIITLLAGVCLGGALALGREYLDRSIHDTRALNDLELPVLGEIPRISHVS
jgi:polysaccharide chain length determinant protein (PEP-CTERM system associated)